MKYLLVLLILFFASCNEHPPVPQKPYKFKQGEVVYVGKDKFIVEHLFENNRYYLDKVDCHSRYCDFVVNENEISKTPKNE